MAAGAIPISQRQIAALRDKNRVLQEKLAELIRFGEENDAIADKMHRLAVLLLTFKRLSDLVHDLNFDLRENFSVPRCCGYGTSPADRLCRNSAHQRRYSRRGGQLGASILRDPHNGRDPSLVWGGRHAAALFCDGGAGAQKTIGLLVIRRGSAAVLSGNGNGLALMSCRFLRRAHTAPAHTEETNQHDQR